MQIHKNGSRQLTANFSEMEFYSSSSDAPESHYQSDESIEASQILRDWAGVPVTVNSTYRTKTHNDAVGSSDRSQHRISTAVDYDMEQKRLEEAKENIRQRGDLFRKLRAVGINGFGLYKGFIHLDSRPEGGKQKDSFGGTYAYWDNDQKKK